MILLSDVIIETMIDALCFPLKRTNSKLMKILANQYQQVIMVSVLPQIKTTTIFIM